MMSDLSAMANCPAREAAGEAGEWEECECVTEAALGEKKEEKKKRDAQMCVSVYICSLSITWIG